jgi:hypothetical protein
MIWNISKEVFFSVCISIFLLLPVTTTSQVNLCNIFLTTPTSLASDSIPLISPQLSVSGDTIHTIWFGLDISQISSNDGIQYCHSFDGGATFSGFTTIVSADSAFSPGLIACSGQFVYVSYTAFNDGIFGVIFLRSSDAGLTWEQSRMILQNMRPRLIGALESTIYIHYESGRGGNNGLLRSDDYGLTWQTVNSNMFLLDDLQITNNTIYAVGTFTPDHTEVGFLYSPDRGSTWIGPEILSKEDNTSSLRPKIAVNSTETIFVVWNDIGTVILRRSNGYDENDNLTWSPLVIVSSDRYAVFLDIAVSGKFVSIVWDNQVSNNRFILNNHSSDEANNFCPPDTLSQLNESGEPSVLISYNRVHFIWSEGIGSGGKILYRQGRVHEATLPITYTLHQNYPNPVNGITHIEYELQTSGHVSLILYNILGQKVATIVNEIQEADIYNIPLDVNQYPSGVYFYRLTTRQFNETKKLVILR